MAGEGEERRLLSWLREQNRLEWSQMLQFSMLDGTPGARLGQMDIAENLEDVGGRRASMAS